MNGRETALYGAANIPTRFRRRAATKFSLRAKRSSDRKAFIPLAPSERSWSFGRIGAATSGWGADQFRAYATQSLRLKGIDPDGAASKLMLDLLRYIDGDLT